MEEGLIAHFLASAAVVALVADRIAWGLNDQANAVPRIVLTKVSDVPEYHTSGQSNLGAARVQIDCYATTALGALRVARAVKQSVPKRQFSKSGIDFSITQLNERQSVEAESPTSRLHRVSIDFQVWHTEP